MVRHNYIIFKNGELHSREYQECNWMFNIFGLLKIDTVMDVTTQNIKEGDQTIPSVELVLDLPWDLSFT